MRGPLLPLLGRPPPSPVSPQILAPQLIFFHRAPGIGNWPLFPPHGGNWGVTLTLPWPQCQFASFSHPRLQLLLWVPPVPPKASPCPVPLWQTVTSPKRSQLGCLPLPRPPPLCSPPPRSTQLSPAPTIGGVWGLSAFVCPPQLALHQPGFRYLAPPPPRLMTHSSQAA